MSRRRTAWAIRWLAVLAVAASASWLWAGEVAVFDAQGLEFPDTLTLTCLQGVVNRDAPRLYLSFRKTDPLWADFYSREFGLRLVPVKARDDLVRRFRDRLKGYAVWDPDAPDTANLAATLAGLEDCLVVAPEQVASASGVGYTNPDHMSAADLDRLLAATRKCLEKSDMRTLTVLTSRLAGEDLARRYAAALGPWVIGCVEGYARCEGQDYAFGGMPWLRTQLPRWSRFRREQMLADIRQLAAERPERPLFLPVHVFCYEQTIDDMAWLARQLDPKAFKVVRPDELLAAAAKHYAERLVVDLPRQLWVLGGARNRLDFSLQSFMAGAVEGSIAFRFAPGPPAGTETRQFRILRDQRQGLSVDLPAENADRIEAVMATIRYGEVAEERRVGTAVVAAPPGLAGPGTVASFFSTHAAAQLQRRIGTDVADPQATGGTARAAVPGKDAAGEHLVFGPYEPAPQGRYLAAWRLAALGDLGDKPLATLDVFDYPGGEKQHARREVQGSDFAASRAYQWFFLPFDLPGAGTLEYRVVWHGGAELRADRVVVWRLGR